MSTSTRGLTVRQAAFIGVGSMVGAGIFSLLGAAGEVAGAAVWVSFLMAGAIAGLQGYSFAKFGARFPSGGGLLEYVARGFGDGHVTGIVAWLVLSANAIVTAMVAVSFGSYASAAFAGESATWATVFAVVVVVAMSAREHHGIPTGRERADRGGGRGHRDPRGVRGRDARDHGSRPALAERLPAAPGHRVERRPDLLRVPGLRRHHLHGEGPRRSAATAPQGDVPRARDRDHDLRRRGAGRVRDAHGRRGDLVRRHRARRCGGAGAGQGGLLAHDGDGAVRHRRGDQRRPLPGEGPVRASRVHRAVSAAARAHGRRPGPRRVADHGREPR